VRLAGNAGDIDLHLDVSLVIVEVAPAIDQIPAQPLPQRCEKEGVGFRYHNRLNLTRRSLQSLRPACSTRSRVSSINGDCRRDNGGLDTFTYDLRRHFKLSGL
jgi:hypothetical protein